jgi:acetylornithine deacetylase/succinyl-diaminopimelate desuccinylase-like protein
MLGEAGIPCIAGFGPVGGKPHGVDEWLEVQTGAAILA